MLRNHNNDLISKSSETYDVLQKEKDEVIEGAIKNTKKTWHMPRIELKDQSQLSMYWDIQNKGSSNITFINRQCDRLTLQKNREKIDWKLNIAAGAETPRCISLAYQSRKENLDQRPSNIPKRQLA